MIRGLCRAQVQLRRSELRRQQQQQGVIDAYVALGGDEARASIM